MKRALKFIVCFVVICCVLVLPISADFSSVGGSSMTTYTARNRTPITVYWRITAPSGEVGYVSYHIGEVIDVRSGEGRSGSFVVDGYTTTFRVQQSFQRNDSFPDDIARAKGAYQIQITSTECDVAFVGVDWGSITLPHKYNNESQPMDRNLPKVVIGAYSTTGSVNDYRVKVYNVDGDEFKYAETGTDYSKDKTWSIRQSDLEGVSAYTFSAIPPFLTYEDVTNLIGGDSDVKDVLPIFESGVVCDYSLNPSSVSGDSSGNVVSIQFPSNYNGLQIIDSSAVDNTSRFDSYSSTIDRLPEGWFGDRVVEEVVVSPDFDFTNWISTAFGFFDVELFGNFTIGGLLSVVVGIGLFIAFLRIFAGG